MGKSRRRNQQEEEGQPPHPKQLGMMNAAAVW
jgi:hypothetical protein